MVGGFDKQLPVFLGVVKKIKQKWWF